jgi:putative DNA primase/helicase
MDMLRQETPDSQGVIPENIPEELTRRPQWVVWRLEERDGKPTKIPYIAGGVGMAKSADLMTWRGFEEALKAYRTGRYSGIGFVFSSADPYAGIDLDKCRDPETGEIEGWAKEIVDAFDSYTEASQSGTGLHIIVRGKAPGKRRGGVEAYSQERFFATTGAVI